ncbi:hypothetical protein AHAS_Ahas12G0157400 [Arachis hypogaea]
MLFYSCLGLKTIQIGYSFVAPYFKTAKVHCSLFAWLDDFLHLMSMMGRQFQMRYCCKSRINLKDRMM